MDIPQLRCFLAVADELHFGRAAQRLHLTPSPVSRAVKDLEAELGVALFVRGYHQVQLTDAGTALATQVRQILDEVEQLKSVARQFRGGRRVVRLGLTHLATPSEVDRFVSTVQDTAGLPVDVELATSGELLAALRDRKLDLAFVHLPVDDPAIETAVVARQTFKLVMRADDPLASASGLYLSDLADRVFTVPAMVTQPTAIARLHHLVQAAGITSLVEMPDADPFKLATHIRQNRGIALALDPALGGPSQVFSDAAYATVDLLDDVKFELGAAWNRATPNSDPVLDRLVHRFQRSPAAPRAPD